MNTIPAKNRVIPAALLALLLLVPSISLAENWWLDNLRADKWTATWATASKIPVPGFDPAPPAINNMTLRQIVRISEGGREVRVWLTNEFGTAPLAVAAASIAIQDSGAAITPDTYQPLTFGGSAAVTIAPGARVVSDPVELRLGDRTDLAISIYLPDDLSASASPVTQHVRALQTNYLASGNQVAAMDLDGADTTTAWHFLAAVDVSNYWPMPVIALLGDSITDGDQMAAPNEPVDQNARLGDFLSEAIINGNRAAGVINLGISGNQATTSFLGENPQARLSRDVLTQTGVTHVLFLEGINDIGLPVLLSVLGIPTPEISAEAIIESHRQLAQRARASGLTVIGATLTPAGGSPLPGYSGEIAEQKRQAVNDWIRSSGAYDVVVDLDAALRDPSNPTSMRADLTADGLHPNSEGYRIAAETVFGAIAAQLAQKRYEGF